MAPNQLNYELHDILLFFIYNIINYKLNYHDKSSVDIVTKEKTNYYDQIECKFTSHVNPEFIMSRGGLRIFVGGAKKYRIGFKLIN